MAGTQLSASAKLRARLNHPIIDSDGHTMEFVPAFLDYLKQVGGATLVDRFKTGEGGDGGIGFGYSNGYKSDWYGLTPQERRARRVTRPAWWALPTKNTLDRATATFPKLLHERLDETGIDFSVVYPTIGLSLVHLRDEELRRAACRALNMYHADIFAEYKDRLAVAAAIPMHTPTEAIEEMEYAVGRGLKAVMMASYVMRPISAAADKLPADWLGRPLGYWIDNLCLDSEYDYDRLWAKCVELRIPSTFHSGAQGWDGHGSVTNYMYNHIGHFARTGQALCKALFMAGVTRRFPRLRFGFLECGVAWAASLYADMIGHWKKRNGRAIENYNPANFNHEMFVNLARRYGGKLMEGRIEALRQKLLGFTNEDPATLDDWAACGIEKPQDIRDLFVPSFYFGCEADDPTNAMAFSKANPFGARLNAVFSSDIGHWDVPDMREVGEESYELVEEGLITEEDYRDFVFANPARLWTSMNPDFFKGTVVEDAVRKLDV